MTEQRVPIPPAAAERAGKLMATAQVAKAAAEAAQFRSSLYLQALADMTGYSLEQIGGVDDAANELIVTVPEATEEST